MRQMRKLAQELGVSILLLHHRGKQGGDGNEGAIGSISFVAQSDQRLSLNVRNQQRLLRVSGRYPTAPFTADEEFAFEVDADGARIVATKAELTTDAILGALQQFDGEPANLKIGSWPTGSASEAPTLDTVASRYLKAMVKAGDAVCSPANREG